MNNCESIEPMTKSQTVAQNERLDNVLTRIKEKEIIIPDYQRDSDQWDANKKSLFIESILNRLTVPSFYLAASEDDPEVQEIVDGQQRLTTLIDFYDNKFELSQSDKCPYYGSSSHYAGKTFSENNCIEDSWKKIFKSYNITLVNLPSNLDISLRLEIFRRINEGGTPLSAQDIRLSYYSQSERVKFIQAVGIFDKERNAAKRILSRLNCKWPWEPYKEAAELWQSWWSGRKLSIGQKASEMFLWYLISEYQNKMQDLIKDINSIRKLRLNYRGNSDDVLNIFCARLQEEELTNEEKLMPSLDEIKDKFINFMNWWHKIRTECGKNVSVDKHRIVALMIAPLSKRFVNNDLSSDQWNLLGLFLDSSRKTAADELGVTLPEPKGKWASQSKQFAAFDTVAAKIAKK
ncbi:DUF262 domain-containing protein [Desulfonatronovibrio magnus]|uniref:DUF262 domain-containing protein n=1 Tax=Desulfonatronovibrio magnus TaxID=698827 RepID=UPI0006990044|nr:DUF262 domain-containing protein [Desulfonatronovibrio magnus]